MFPLLLESERLHIAERLILRNFGCWSEDTTTAHGLVAVVELMNEHQQGQKAPLDVILLLAAVLSQIENFHYRLPKSLFF